MADVLLDNDVILKTCCYDAVDEAINCLAGPTRTICVLTVVKFVLSNVIHKRKNIANKPAAADRLSSFLKRVSLMEPAAEELALAAEFEEFAQSRGLELDSGESQLLAALIRRSAAVLVTGDKRAIVAIERIVVEYRQETEAARRIACLEQMILALVGRHGAEVFHPRVCIEALIDTAIAISFSCKTGRCDSANVARALRSYINDVRRRAPTVLVDSDDLSTVIT